VDDGNKVYDSRNNSNAVIRTADNVLIAGCNGTVVPSGVETIDNFAFAGSGISSVTIPSSVKTINTSAFINSALKNVVISEGLQTIGATPFANCSSLESLNIPASVVNIAAGLTYGCDGMTKLSVSEGNTTYNSVNDNALMATSTGTLVAGINSTVVPAGTLEIGSGAFWGLGKISEVELPEGVKLIGNDAFGECKGLKSVVLPESLASVGNASFDGCSALTSVTSLNTTCPAIESNSFSSAKSATLYVPYGCGEKYSNANYWKDFSKIEELAPSSVARVKANENADDVWYSVSGVKLDTGVKGINIHKGRKVYVK
jgi:hypothetical protein